MNRSLVVVVFSSLMLGCGDSSSDFRGGSWGPELTCGAPDSTSVWAPQNGSTYTLATSMPADGDDWLAEPLGVAATASEVWIFDGQLPALLRYSPDLEDRAEYGRAGEGPGEFWESANFSGDWISTVGGQIAVFDGVRLHLFNRAGQFLEGFSPGDGALNPFEVHRIQHWNESLVFGRDITNLGEGTRRLEIWLAQIDSQFRIQTIPLPDLPKVSAGYVSGGIVDQATPSWDIYGNCLYFVDGSASKLVREDLHSGKRDSLPLPRYSPPAPQPSDLARKARMAQFSRAISRDEARDLKPTAPATWSDLRVDPAGHVWLEPWRPWSYQDSLVKATIVRPDGSLDSITLPTFPRDFGGPGKYYAIIQDSLDVATLGLFEISTTN